MDRMSLDTIFLNLNTNDVFNGYFPEDINKGGITRGVKGNLLVLVFNSTSIFTRIINFFRGISTDSKLVGKVINATEEALLKDERLIVLKNKIDALAHSKAKNEVEPKDVLDRIYAFVGC